MTPEEILKKVRKIEISTRRTVESVLSGQYHTRFKGQGMQFSDFREYYAGDDIRHIDWKVTARTQSAHIKKFEEERDLTIYLLVDISRSGMFGSENKTKAEVLIETCALLTFAAIQNNDRVGLILFSDQIEKHIPPKKGRTHAMRLVTEILTYQPKSKGTNIGKALDYYADVNKHPAVVFVASDFYDQDYEKSLKRVARKHDVIALRVVDPREKQIPAIGLLEMQDLETGEPFWINTSSYQFQSQFKKNAEQFEATLHTTFLQAGVDKLEVSTNEDYFAKVALHFTKRRRRPRR
ncbi:MAG: DUF58 domain-containing protein [Bacteriovoracia bacterium]